MVNIETHLKHTLVFHCLRLSSLNVSGES